VWLQCSGFAGGVAGWLDVAVVVGVSSGLGGRFWPAGSGGFPPIGLPGPAGRPRSAVRGEHLEAFERAEDRAGPAPVGREV
jgi:hypothetical protein